MEITGQLIKLLPVQTGTGQKGNWIKQEFVVETMDQYPKKVCMGAWGDIAAGMDQYSPGEKLKISFNPESREYNEKWYTELRAWKIERTGGSANKKETKQEVQENTTSTNDSDLPF